jgi:hypothetical protein
MDMKLSTVLFSNFLRFVKNTDVPILLCLVHLREKDLVRQQTTGVR